jgi:osmotically-inducible protein OsmY
MIEGGEIAMEYMEYDLQLQRDIMDELEWEPSVNTAAIRVDVKDGVVTLSGNVDSYAEKRAAEKAVERICDVLAVVEEIEVRPPAPNERKDEDIARAAAHALEWHTLVPNDKVTAIVEDAWITLDGAVERRYQKRIAEEAVHHLAGVRGITNSITVKPKGKPKQVKEEITKAFERSARIDAEHIRVEMHGNKVILHGVVHSWAEKRAAENAANAAPGIAEVENLIRVLPDTNE